MYDRGEMQGCAELKENKGGGVSFFMVLVKRCEEAEGSFSLQKNIRYKGRIFASVAKILSLHQLFSCIMKTKIKEPLC